MGPESLRDLTSWPVVRAVSRSPLFPVVLQVAALFAVIALAINGLGVGHDLSGAELKLLRKTSLTTLVVWGLWWPGMIAAALLLGRAWCTVCPMELSNRLGDALARRVGWPRARLGRWLRAGWATLALYLAMQLLVAGVALHRYPHLTAVMVFGLLALALGTGLVFRTQRSFCTAFCPASALLSVYGRLTPLQLARRDADTCERCETLDCVAESNRQRFDRRSCPSLLRPYRRESSDGCVLCLQCVKVCPHDNLGFGVVDAAEPVRRKALLRPFEAGFVAVALGFVAHEVIGEVKWLDHHFHAPPEALSALLPAVPFGWFEALWFLALFPALLWCVIGLAGLAAGHRGGLRTLLLAAATGAAPLVAIAHLAKAVAKVSAWSGFLPGAFVDPRGVETFERITAGAQAAPQPLVGLGLLGWVMLLLSLVVAWRAWRWVRDVPAESRAAARTGLLASGLLFVAVLVIWSLPAP
jgi:polyferredoxin